jgi:dUTP pyrophosphatase
MDELKVKLLSKDSELPEYALNSDVAFDLRSNESLTISSFEQKEIKTGIAIQIPEGYIGLVRDRVGLITKMGLHVVAGTFNHQYTNEVSVVMINFGKEEVVIEKGMRIAQIVIVPVKKLKIKEAKSIKDTERTGREFGSTGFKEIVRELNKIGSKKAKKS